MSCRIAREYRESCKYVDIVSMETLVRVGAGDGSLDCIEGTRVGDIDTDGGLAANFVDGVAVSKAVGASVGVFVGEDVGGDVGSTVEGDKVGGAKVGTSVGLPVGEDVGGDVGSMVEGGRVGAAVNPLEGFEEGSDEGAEDETVCKTVGPTLGPGNGCRDPETVGYAEGRREAAVVEATVTDESMHISGLASDS